MSQLNEDKVVLLDNMFLDLDGKVIKPSPGLDFEGSIAGPAGADGVDGAVGPTGPTGATGPEGPAGADGLDGGDPLTVYPVGAIYLSVVSTSPATLFGGTWSAFGAGRVLVGFASGDADFGTVEGTGGGKTHSHSGTSTAENRNHTHAGASAQAFVTYPGSGGGAGLASGSTVTTKSTTDGVSQTHTHNVALGSGTADSSIQPYITVYMWKRTA